MFTSIYIIIFQLFDPGEVLYIYESPAGYGLVGMRLVGWLWFCYAIFFTLKHYPEKASFYYPFFVFYTLWYVYHVHTVTIEPTTDVLYMSKCHQLLSISANIFQLPLYILFKMVITAKIYYKHMVMTCYNFFRFKMTSSSDLLCPLHWREDILFLLFPPSSVRPFPVNSRKSIYPIFTKFGMGVY